MKNPIDKMIKVMSLGVGLVSIIVLSCSTLCRLLGDMCAPEAPLQFLAKKSNTAPLA